MRYSFLRLSEGHMVEHVATAKDCAGQAKLILTLEPLRFRVSRSRNTQPRRLALSFSLPRLFLLYQFLAIEIFSLLPEGQSNRRNLARQANQR